VKETNNKNKNGGKIMAIWYAVTTTNEYYESDSLDLFKYGSYDIEEAIKMAKAMAENIDGSVFLIEASKNWEPIYGERFTIHGEHDRTDLIKFYDTQMEQLLPYFRNADVKDHTLTWLELNSLYCDYYKLRECAAAPIEEAKRKAHKEKVIKELREEGNDGLADFWEIFLY
jgi:hypothetical protein